MPRVLVVEDDASIAALLVRALRREGLDVDAVTTGEDALGLVARAHVDLVVLDLGLPGLDGITVCRRLRAEGRDVGVLMLTARTSELDEVLGLDVGADDYVAKPFSLAVLLARVRALLRRDEPVSLEVAGLRIDRLQHRAWRGERELVLSPKEFALLALLAGRAGETVTRDRIMAEVWQPGWWGSTKTLNVHIGWLRQKLGEPGLISTVRGVGFRLETT